MKRFLQYLSEQKRRLNSDYIDLFHGTVAHPVDFTRGIETQRGKGIYGSQGPGFYGWTQRRAARKHAEGIATGGFSKATSSDLNSNTSRQMMVSTRTHISNLIPDAETIQFHTKTLGVLKDWHTKHEDRINFVMQKHGSGSTMKKTQYGSLLIKMNNQHGASSYSMPLNEPNDSSRGSRHLSTALELLHKHDRSLVDDLVRNLHAVGMKHNIGVGFRHVGKNIPKEQTKIS